MTIKDIDIKTRRKELGLTQMQLAAKVGVCLMTIRLWENYAGKPSEENLDRLLEVLKLPADNGGK